MYMYRASHIELHFLKLQIFKGTKQLHINAYTLIWANTTIRALSVFIWKIDLILTKERLNSSMTTKMEQTFADINLSLLFSRKTNRW